MGSPLRPVFAVRRWLLSGADGMDLTTLDRLVLLVLASYMDQDGTNGRPGSDTLAAIANVTDRAVARSLARLSGRRGLQPALLQARVEQPRIGLRQEWEFSSVFREMLLTESMTAGSPSTAEKRMTGKSASREERVTLGSERVTLGSEEGDRGVTPTDMTDIDRARGEARLEVSEEEILAEAARIAASKGGGKGLARKIAREDRDTLSESIRSRKRAQIEAGLIEACPVCDSTGFIDLDDGTPTGTRARCAHPTLSSTAEGVA